MLSVIRADITAERVDAIVNAANRALAGGGGVDGAIHRAAGPDLARACREIPEVEPGVRCPTGEARITPGFELPASWVIHTVGPVWAAGLAEECDRHLAACYRSSLAMAEENGCASIAFPCISTGVYGFPQDRAADIAVATVREVVERLEHVGEVRFVCFSESDHRIYTERL